MIASILSMDSPSPAAPLWGREREREREGEKERERERETERERGRESKNALYICALFSLRAGVVEE